MGDIRKLFELVERIDGLVAVEGRPQGSNLVHDAGRLITVQKGQIRKGLRTELRELIGGGLGEIGDGDFDGTMDESANFDGGGG